MSDERTSDLASVVEAVLTAEARDAKERTPDERARLLRRLLEIPLPDASSLILVRTPTLDVPIIAKLARGEKFDQESAADVAAPSLGLSMLRIERGDKTLKLRLRRPAELEPSRPVKVRLEVYTKAEDAAAAKLVLREVELKADGKPVDLRWDGAALVP